MAAWEKGLFYVLVVRVASGIAGETRRESGIGKREREKGGRGIEREKACVHTYALCIYVRERGEREREKRRHTQNRYPSSVSYSGKCVMYLRGILRNTVDREVFENACNALTKLWCFVQLGALPWVFHENQGRVRLLQLSTGTVLVPSASITRRSFLL